MKEMGSLLLEPEPAPNSGLTAPIMAPVSSGELGSLIHFGDPS